MILHKHCGTFKPSNSAGSEEQCEEWAEFDHKPKVRPLLGIFMEFLREDRVPSISNHFWRLDLENLGKVQKL